MHSPTGLVMIKTSVDREVGVPMRKKQLKSRLATKNRQNKKVDSSVEILGVSISSTRKVDLLKKLWLQRKEMLHVATVNS